MGQTLKKYKHSRERGFAPWRPAAKTRPLVEQVQKVLDDYAPQLPLSLRQIFYVLVGQYGYPKKENAYERLGDHMVRARRAGLISFDHIRDDGQRVEGADGFTSVHNFWFNVQNWAENYTRQRQHGQPAFLEVWCEAAGMVPQLVRVARPYGVPVYSSGGFDSLTVKHEAAQRFERRAKKDSQRTCVLHLGDHDPSGQSIFDAIEDDIQQLYNGLAGEERCASTPQFVRVAATEEQISRYSLETVPPKGTDKRGEWEGGTVQCEAMPPDILANELREAIESRLDMEIYRALLDEEEHERKQISAHLSEVLP